ncbi:MAG: OmpA family protein [Bacteroidales bacterium]|nr:OmpA family protein [Bacteroidales bacterium]
MLKKKCANFKGFAGCLYLGILLTIPLLYSCKSTKLATADSQYDRGEYYAASNSYKKIYNKTSPNKQRDLRGMISAKLGFCYEKINIPAKSSASFTNAIRYNNSDSTLYLHLAKSLQKEGKYKDALKNYLIFIEKFGDNEEIQKTIDGIELATEWKEKKNRYIVRKADIFNSRRAEFSPALYGKSQDILYITSSTDKALGSKKSEITGIKNNDIFFSKKDEKGVWKRPEPIEGDVNTEFDEGATSFNQDGSKMFFTKAVTDHLSPKTTDIYMSTRNGGKWDKAVKIEIGTDSIYVYAHPALAPDEKTLYFVSDRPGGYGGKDIWKGTLNANKLENITNLGSNINTSGDEMFPYVSNDGILYFSSNGLPGMGGLDIFKARLDSWGIWHVENMKAPINSNYDDFGITFYNKEEEEGFFSSNRGDARGYDHIFSFFLPSIKINISGYVTDKDDTPINSAIVRIIGLDGSNSKAITKQDGSFSIKINRGINYVMMAGAKGYLNTKEEFISDNEEADANYEVNFKLASISKPVLIENIFYDFNKASLRPESKKALDELIELLNNNPHVTIELGAHTDRKGSEKYNIDLSQRRAQSVIDYLIKGGIETRRLTPKGYGKSVPKVVSKRIASQFDYLPEGTILNENFVNTLTEEQKEQADQLNRRTEFKVLTIDYGLQ